MDGRASVHEEWLEGFVRDDGAFEGMGLAAEFSAEAGAEAVLLAGELAGKAALIGSEKTAAPFCIEIATAVAIFEVICGAQHIMAKEVEGEAVGYGGAEGFHEIKGEGGASVGGRVEESEERV
jgi:hypothetical protein